MNAAALVVIFAVSVVPCTGWRISPLAIVLTALLIKMCWEWHERNKQLLRVGWVSVKEKDGGMDRICSSACPFFSLLTRTNETGLSTYHLS